jgi:hypothetical protein
LEVWEGEWVDGAEDKAEGFFAITDATVFFDFVVEGGADDTEGGFEAVVEAVVVVAGELLIDEPGGCAEGGG